jgi:hypothetical protein
LINTVSKTYVSNIAEAKQSASLPDGTILTNRGVGVWRGSGWREIEGGMGGVAETTALCRFNPSGSAIDYKQASQNTMH